MVIEQAPPTISKKKTSMESRMVMDLRVRTSAKVLAVHPMILIRPKEEKKRTISTKNGKGIAIDLDVWGYGGGTN